MSEESVHHTHRDPRSGRTMRDACLLGFIPALFVGSVIGTALAASVGFPTGLVIGAGVFWVAYVIGAGFAHWWLSGGRLV